MNERIKQEWLKRLRSGEYRQARSALKTRDGRYCCLGVLCDIYLEEIGGEWSKVYFTIEGYEDRFDYKVAGCEFYLPMEVMEWASLENNEGWSNGLLRHQEGCQTLAIMNDAGKSFEEIALVIEEKL